MAWIATGLERKFHRSLQTFIKLHDVYRLRLSSNSEHLSTLLSRKLPPRSVVCGNCYCTAPKKSSGKMLAWQIQQYGGNQELTLNQNARLGTIKSPSELLIRVHATSVNPIDYKMRGGYGADMLNALRKRAGFITVSEFPLILGRDFSGVVVETGQEVKKFKPGDEVWGALSGLRQGCHSQFTIASEKEICKKPESLTHLEASSIPYVAVTTWTALSTIGELKEKNAAGKRVLVLGGSGGIGTFAIQLLKAWGANVTATCSQNAMDFVQSLGADTVIDYRSSELNQQPPFDFVLDTIGGKTAENAFGLLKMWKNAKLVTLVTPFFRNADSMGIVAGGVVSSLDLTKNLAKGLLGGKSFRWCFFLPNAKALAAVKQLVDKGLIKPVVEKEFPFSELPAAFDKLERGHSRGKTVINVLNPS